mmetsp:Transcript_25225/g.72982  ORF Transcript_25225/g.72982 Transcript_25225/m.72982 type:complete len:227 (+) Transcript_25225:1188-1868(+)
MKLSIAFTLISLVFVSLTGTLFVDSAQVLIDDAPAPEVTEQGVRGYRGKGGKGSNCGGKGGSKGYDDDDDCGDTCSEACPDPTFIYNPTKLTWSEHEDIAYGRGCHLASIHSNEEQAQVFAAIGSSDTDTWLGGTPPSGQEVSTDPNAWVWSDSSCMDHFNWVDGEPSGSAGDPNGATCMEMDVDLSSKGSSTGWNDDECFKRNPGVYRCCDDGQGKGKGGSKGHE